MSPMPTHMTMYNKGAATNNGFLPNLSHALPTASATKRKVKLVKELMYPIYSLEIPRLLKYTLKMEEGIEPPVIKAKAYTHKISIFLGSPKMRNSLIFLLSFSLGKSLTKKNTIQNNNESIPMVKKKMSNPMRAACPERTPPMVHPMPVATLYRPKALPFDEGKYSVIMAGIKI